VSKLTGIFIAFTTLFLALAVSGSLVIYIDIPSILIVGGLTLGGILTGYGSHGFTLLLIPLKKESDINNDTYFQVVSFYQFLANLVIGAAFAAVFISVIGLLSNMDDPKKIGPAIAISLLSVFYAITFILIFVLPLKHNFIQKNLVSLNKEQKNQIKHESKLQKKLITVSSISLTVSISTLYLTFQYYFS